MQKFPSWGGRAEFISSVPSLCQVTKALSIGVPSGGPGSLPHAVNVTCHMPTIGSAASETFSNESDRKPSESCQDCRWSSAPYWFESPHAAFALTVNKLAETSAKTMIL